MALIIFFAILVVSVPQLTRSGNHAALKSMNLSHLKLHVAIWQIQMKDVLTQLCVRKTLQPRPADMADDKWEDLVEKAFSAL
jgi:hypothetical protein